jgi:mRNA-degrading endonuclease YafQ of YafQ-DinJ toxin-antitoxin module
MIAVDFEHSFERALKKLFKQKRLSEDVFFEKLDIFIQNPHNPILQTHKLSGKLKGLSAFSLGYDLRAVFYFETPNKAILVDIGNHNEVY